MKSGRSLPAVIFDLGNVLLNFQPRSFLADRYAGEEERVFYAKVIFGSKFWLDLDKGVTTQQEVIQALSQLYPDRAGEIRDIFADWFSMLTPIEENIAWVRRLKERGYPLYILSNYHGEAFTWAQRRYPWLRLFDGMVISAHVRQLKPDPEIFHTLLSRYGINPKESYFIDDTPANLYTAEGLGIKGILCENPAQLGRELTRLFG